MIAVPDSDPGSGTDVDPDAGFDAVADAERGDGFGDAAEPAAHGAGAQVAPGAPDEASLDTGDARVDDIIARLRDVDELALRDQVAVFETVHVELQDYVADAAD